MCTCGILTLKRLDNIQFIEDNSCSNHFSLGFVYILVITPKVAAKVSTYRILTLGWLELVLSLGRMSRHLEMFSVLEKNYRSPLALLFCWKRNLCVTGKLLLSNEYSVPLSVLRIHHWTRPIAQLNYNCPHWNHNKSDEIWKYHLQHLFCGGRLCKPLLGVAVTKQNIYMLQAYSDLPWECHVY